MPKSGKTRTFNFGNLGLVYGSQMEPSSKVGYQLMSRSFGSAVFVSLWKPIKIMVLNFICSGSWKNYTYVRNLRHFATVLFLSVSEANI